MARKKIKYQEGDIFAVPLKDSGFVLGIITRVNHDKKGGLGYFYGRRYETVPEFSEIKLENISPDMAILKCRFGDLGLVKNRWPIFGNHSSFSQYEWDINYYLHQDPVSNEFFIRNSTDDYQFLNEVPAGDQKTTDIVEDGLWSAASIEIRLSKLISSKR